MRSEPLSCEEFERALDVLPPETLSHLSVQLRERAVAKRRQLTVHQVRAEASKVWLCPAWRSSILIEVGRVRETARHLMLEGWRPEQFVAALAQVGLEDASSNGLLIAVAIGAGIEGAEGLLEGDDADRGHEEVFQAPVPPDGDSSGDGGDVGRGELSSVLTPKGIERLAVITAAGDWPTVGFFRRYGSSCDV
jgi:hypothetical protein